MGAIAVFDYSAFIARYPQFTSPGGAQPVSQALATAYFNEATLFLRNDGSGPVCDIPTQSVLLNLLVAHIATMNAPLADGSMPSPLVGRVTNASEGSVSVGTSFDAPAGTEQWFLQTKFGAEYWAATAGYRMMHYRPGPVMGVPANQGYAQGYGGFYGYGRGRY